jgi:hypothetical protein
MRRLLTLALLLALTAPAAAPADAPPPAPGALLTDERERAIAPGLELTSFETLDRTGWTRAHMLTADLREQRLHADLLGTAVSAKRTVTAHADAAGAAAAVNGDFFAITTTQAAIGPEIGGGVLRKALAAPELVAGVGEDRIARLA